MNNRQNGRRRGRSGGQPPRGGQQGNADRGNRIDNRARGNASQLYEKYKALARDTHMQGDRVNTEYYLQFADHYFRVLNESRARFEEQRRPGDADQPRDDFTGNEDQDDGFDDNEGLPEQPRREAPREDRRPRRDEPRSDNRDQPQPRRETQRDGQRETQRDGRDGPREPREQRDPYPPREAREPRESRELREPRTDEPRMQVPVTTMPVGAMAAVDAAPEGEPREERRPRRRARSEASPANDSPSAPPIERIEIDRLPPAFAPEPRVEAAVPATVVPANDAVEPEDKPRVRRTRRPRGEAAAVVDG